MKKKICVVVSSRANYSSIKSAMRAIESHDGLELILLVGASAIIDRYGGILDLIKKDGFNPDGTFHMLIEGSNPTTMAKSTGLGLIELPNLFERFNPDIVLTVGDRFETMSTTLAAAYMNIPLAHTMGGEVSGTIDESIRHAITKFAHIHFPACEGAKQRIIRLGENPNHVHMVGCPRIDLVSELISNNSFTTSFSEYGVGGVIDLNKPFLLVSQHPVTTEFGESEKQIKKTLEAINELKIPAIILWPNADAGTDDIAKGIRNWREQKKDTGMHFFKNLPISDYVFLMRKTACLVGNSSSGIREGAFIGTPVVNIGSRQNARDRGKNVIDVDYDSDEIIKAIKLQIKNGKYNSENIYGDGQAGHKIADILFRENVAIQKKITY